MRKVTNFGPETAIQTSVKLIFDSNEEIKMVTDLTPLFFSEKKVLFALKEALNRGVRVKILFDPNTKVKKLKKFQKLVQEHMTYITLKKMQESPPYHFWVIDGIHIRLEEPHPFGEIKEVRGEIRYNTLKLASHYDKIFSHLWSL